MVKKFQRHLLSFQPWSQSALITSSKCLPIHPPGPHPFLLANRRAALRSINNFNFPIPPAEKTLFWSLPLVPPLIFLFSTAFPCRLSHREKEHSKIGKNHPFYSQGSPPPSNSKLIIPGLIFFVWRRPFVRPLVLRLVPSLSCLSLLALCLSAACVSLR